MSWLRVLGLMLTAMCIASLAAYVAPPATATASSTPGTASPSTGAASTGGGSPVRVVTSIHPISALVREVGGPGIEVSTLITPGADPHHFELTPSKARALDEAKIIMLIGGPFDEWMLPGGEKPGGESGEPYMVVRFNEAFTDSLIPLEDSFNPHFWLDPMFAREMARIVAVALCTVDLANCEAYRERAADLIADLGGFKASAGDRLAASGFDAYVALHPAWTYFARRFGVREAATLEISHETEPSAKHIAEVVSQMRSEAIGYVVAEEFAGLELARSVAGQTGSRLVLLDPLGSENMPGRDRYLDLMEHNLDVIERSTKQE